jgi:1-phosphofructokinase
LRVSATGILGADNEACFTALFKAKGIMDDFIRAPGETRTNIKLSHDGDTTDINLPGLKVTGELAAEMAAKAEGLVSPGTIALLAGSLPEGVAAGFYADLTARLAAKGAVVLLDGSGPPLKAALSASVLPYAIKPNRAELEAYLGTSLTSDDALLHAARGLIGRGLGLVVVSLGAEGGLFVTAREALRAHLPALRVASTVGAGDAMVAGMIAALKEGADLPRLARLATAFAGGKLTRPGPNLPPRAGVEALADKVQIQ